MPNISYLRQDSRSGLLQESNPPQIPDADARIQAALEGERGSSWSERRTFDWY
jgi:hypothetical protein